MAQASMSTADTPTRMSAVICLLVLVWIVTYWLWEPRGEAQPRVTFADDPVAQGVDGPQSSTQTPVEPVTDPLGTPPPDDPTPADPGHGAVAPEFTEYIVQQGDVSLEIISQKHYGTRAQAAAILKANPFVDPTRLIIGKTRLRLPVDPANIQGQVVAIQPDGSLEPAGPAEASERPAPQTGDIEYVITREDTLWDIAEAYYGKGHLWRKIYEANRDVIADPDRPPVGKTIRIPSLGS